MKKMRKIVPAFAMLMVAAIMMSTASFAWFSMNTTATASGMNVQAKSSGGLAIASWSTAAKAPTANDFSSAATAVYKNGSGVLAPVSHDEDVWYSAKSATINESKVDKEGYKKVESAFEGYYLLTKWDIKTLDETKAFDIVVDAVTIDPNTIGSTTENVGLAKALRVAIKTENGWFDFAPQYDSGAFTYVSAEGTQAAYNTGDNNKLYFSTDDVTILNKVSTTAKTIEVYVYFEGEDDNCISAYAIDLKTLAVTISFTTGAETAVTPSTPVEPETPAESGAIENEPTEG